MPYYFPTLVSILFIGMLFHEGVLSAPKKHANSKVNRSQCEFTDAILGRVLSYLDPNDPNDVNLILRSRNALGVGLGIRQRNRNWQRFATHQQQQSIGMLDYVAKNPLFSGIENVTLGEPVTDLREIASNRHGTNFYLITNGCVGANGNYYMRDLPPYAIVSHVAFSEPSSRKTHDFSWLEEDFTGIDYRSPYYHWQYLKLNQDHYRAYNRRSRLYHRAVFGSDGRFHPAGDLPLIRPIHGLYQMGQEDHQEVVDYLTRVQTFRPNDSYVCLRSASFKLKNRKKLWHYIANLLNHPAPATHCCKPSQLGKRKRDDDPDDSLPPGAHLCHTLGSAWVK